jgi:hypothetical protein
VSEFALWFSIAALVAFDVFVMFFSLIMFRCLSKVLVRLSELDSIVSGKVDRPVPPPKSVPLEIM